MNIQVSNVMQATIESLNDPMFYINKDNQICRQAGPHELRFGQPNNIEGEPISVGLYDMDDCGIVYWEYEGSIATTFNFTVENLTRYINLVITQCAAHYNNEIQF